MRFLTPEAAASRATFTFRLTGSETNPSGLGLSTGRVDFAATTDLSKSRLNPLDGGVDSLFECGTCTCTCTCTCTGMLTSMALGKAINLFFWTSVFTEIKAGNFAQGSSFTMTADCGHMAVLEVVQLCDANDNPITE